MLRLLMSLALVFGLTAGCSAADEQAAPVARTQVILETNHGAIKLELFANDAPKSTENFLAYVRSGFYEGTIFHRVIADFMVQGGGFDEGMARKKTADPIANEADNGRKNDYGTVAMARTSDPHSATAQFFINLKDNDFLNHTGKNSRGWGYAVFGRVVEGLVVVDDIGNVATGFSNGMKDVPKDSVFIERAYVVGDPAEQ
jgi:peptidyl-prolyl cis-trans isomerase B (cyclophilin B)